MKATAKTVLTTMAAMTAYSTGMTITSASRLPPGWLHSTGGVEADSGSRGPEVGVRRLDSYEQRSAIGAPGVEVDVVEALDGPGPAFGAGSVPKPAPGGAPADMAIQGVRGVVHVGHRFR